MDLRPWNEKIKELRSIILKSDKMSESIELALYLHSTVHSSSISGSQTATLEDELWEGLEEDTFRTASKDSHHTIAYHLWHITRIEDITMNMLAAGGSQVISMDSWRERLNTSFFDTGNSMTVEEVSELSREVSMEELKKYRLAVGEKTRAIIKNLKIQDLKRRVDPKNLKRVLEEGAVLNVDTSVWLVDFWGRKNIAGLILMPATRHQVVHLNEAKSAKAKAAAKRGRQRV